MWKLLDSRELWYAVLGVFPGVPILLLAGVVSGSTLWLAGGGFVGLCLATFVPPQSEHRLLVWISLLLLVCGVFVAGIPLLYFGPFALSIWPAISGDLQLLPFLMAPVAVAVHYIWAVASDLVARLHPFFRADDGAA